jgi:hypothetical protein
VERCFACEAEKGVATRGGIVFLAKSRSMRVSYSENWSSSASSVLAEAATNLNLSP